MDSGPGRRSGTSVPLIGRDLPRVFWVTDRAVVERPDFVGRARAILRRGGALQLRAHGLEGRAFLEAARALREGAGTGEAPLLWVNDRIDVALCVRADGVQLGRRSVPPRVARALLGRSCRIGVSVHDPAEAGPAVRSGADLIVLGSIYATGSHPDAAPLGPTSVGRAASCGRPVVAIGGMTPVRVAEVMAAGAWGIAVRSGVWESDDPERAAGEYVAAVRESIAAAVPTSGRNR